MMPITLNNALEDYYQQRFGKLAASTRKHHTGALERFRTWVTKETQPNVYLKDLDDRTMTRYFNRLRPPEYEARSFNNYRQYVKQFFDYCKDEGWILVDPMRHVDAEKPVNYPRLHLSPSELLQMLEDCDPHTLPGPRDRYALAVGMCTALRNQDIAALTIGAINLADNYITAFSHKTKEGTRLPVTAELRSETFRWFEFYAASKGLPDIASLPNNWRLVPALRGAATAGHNGFITVIKQYDQYRHPEEIVHRALRKLGHPTKKEGFHTLRRSAGQVLHDLLVAEGEADPLGAVQALYGHKYQKTTEDYLDINIKKTRRDTLMRGQSILHRAADAHRALNEQIEAANNAHTADIVNEEKRRYA